MSELTVAAQAAKRNPTMKDLVEAQLPAIERQLAGVMNADAFIRTVLSEITKQPKLMSADPQTVLGGIMLAAQLRLEIGAGLGEMWLVPRKDHGRDVCLPVVGFQGLVKLALRSEFVTNVEAFMVREGDDFHYGATADRGMFYEWLPRDFDEDRPWIGVVASARMKAGGTSWVYLTKAQVFKRRPTYWDKGTPWQTHEEEMAKKTAVRALAKFLPKSTDLGRAIEADEGKATYVKGLDEIQISRVDDTIEAEVIDEADPRYVAPVNA